MCLQLSWLNLRRGMAWQNTTSIVVWVVWTKCLLFCSRFGSQPIPLDLLALVKFDDPPQQRSKGILGFSRGGGAGGRREDDPSYNGGATSSPEVATDARSIYPCTIHHNGRLGGVWTVYAETSTARNEWKQKLEEAIMLRRVVTDANKVFEIETLSSDTFLVPSIHATQVGSAWNDENVFTGKVTCSVPFCEYWFNHMLIITLLAHWFISNTGRSWSSRCWLRRGRVDWSTRRPTMCVFEKYPF